MFEGSPSRTTLESTGRMSGRPLLVGKQTMSCYSEQAVYGLKAINGGSDAGTLLLEIVSYRSSIGQCGLRCFKNYRVESPRSLQILCFNEKRGTYVGPGLVNAMRF
jgi:hypothetical protein